MGNGLLLGADGFGSRDLVGAILVSASVSADSEVDSFFR